MDECSGGFARPDRASGGGLVRPDRVSRGELTLDGLAGSGEPTLDGLTGNGELVLRSLVGGGSRGAVWRAERRGSPGRVLAVKLVISGEPGPRTGSDVPADATSRGAGQVGVRTRDPGGHDDALTALREVADVLRDVSHPALLPIEDLAVVGNGTIAVVMPYVAGGSLEDVLATRADPHLPPGLLASLGADVAQALAAAHAAGIRHGSISRHDLLFEADGSVLLGGVGLTDAIASSGRRPAGPTDEELLGDVRALAELLTELVADGDAPSQELHRLLEEAATLPGDRPNEEVTPPLDAARLAVRLAALRDLLPTSRAPEVRPSPEALGSSGATRSRRRTWQPGPARATATVGAVVAAAVVLAAIGGVGARSGLDEATVDEPGEPPGLAAPPATEVGPDARPSPASPDTPSDARSSSPTLGTQPSVDREGLPHDQPEDTAEPAADQAAPPAGEASPRADLAPTTPSDADPVTPSATFGDHHLGEGGPTTPRDPPQPCAGVAHLPDDAAGERPTQLVSVDLDARGCGVPVSYAEGQLHVAHPGRNVERYELAGLAEEAILLAGDWSCDGREGIALYLPRTGETLRFDGLPQPGGEVQARWEPTGGPAGSPSVRLDTRGCAEVVIDPG